jgi:hypothetical protein
MALDSLLVFDIHMGMLQALNDTVNGSGSKQDKESSKGGSRHAVQWPCQGQIWGSSVYI